MATASVWWLLPFPSLISGMAERAATAAAPRCVQELIGWEKPAIALTPSKIGATDKRATGYVNMRKDNTETCTRCHITLSRLHLGVDVRRSIASGVGHCRSGAKLLSDGRQNTGGRRRDDLSVRDDHPLRIGAGAPLPRATSRRPTCPSRPASRWEPEYGVRAAAPSAVDRGRGPSARAAAPILKPRQHHAPSLSAERAPALFPGEVVDVDDAAVGTPARGDRERRVEIPHIADVGRHRTEREPSIGSGNTRQGGSSG
jgi:hypothetical protein